MATIDPAALYPDSLLSSRFSSRFFYFDISSLFYTDERPRGRTKRSTSREKFYKHPIKNGEMCARDRRNATLFSKRIHESNVLSKKVGRDFSLSTTCF